MKKIITSKNAPLPIGPYSHGVLVNNMLFVSGQVGKRADTGELVLADIKAETTQAMENIGAILKEADMNYSHIVKTTIFMKDMNNFTAMNETYGSFFTGSHPARETVQVSRLPLDVNVEISVIAVKS
jgi:2-iminobutanoate/2-iminopropanoate deaminase